MESTKSLVAPVSPGDISTENLYFHVRIDGGIFLIENIAKLYGKVASMSKTPNHFLLAFYILDML